MQASISSRSSSPDRSSRRTGGPISGQVFATVNEIGNVPADTLWFFRRSSLFTLVTLWGVIGVVLTGLVSRLYAQESAVAERRELAASL